MGNLERPAGMSETPARYCDALEAEVETLRAGISWARGMLTDLERPDVIDVFLGSLLDYPEGQ